MGLPLDVASSSMGRFAIQIVSCRPFFLGAFFSAHAGTLSHEVNMVCRLHT